MTGYASDRRRVVRAFDRRRLQLENAGVSPSLALVPSVPVEPTHALPRGHP